MKLSPLHRLVGIALLSCSFLAQAELKLGEHLPIAPQLTVGKLPNGLTYYIQKNGKPEKKVELRLVVKAGSILEDEDQQGLAHFTEHMAFNGSAHFKKSELISYLQSIGVKFGADLNAYTGFDETVYILPIPTDKREHLEQGFLVLEDWAHGLALTDADIDAERGIVLEELRIGKGAEDRINKVLLPKMLNGSRYAQRLPIGKEAVLKNFKYEAVRRFYKDWYRPDLMAVIVVGDIEPGDAEAMIKRHFGKLKNPAKPRPRDYAKVPRRAASEGLVITDKEATGGALHIRYQIAPMKNLPTLADYRDKMIEGLYGDMLGARMRELTQQATPPFVQGASGMNRLVTGYQSFGAYALIGKAGLAPAIEALVQEGERARRFGFSAAELERVKKDMLRNIERAHNERDKSDSGGYAAEYIRNFLVQEPIPGIENELRYTRELLPLITLDEVNRSLRKALPVADKKLVVYTGPEQGGIPTPSPAQLLKLVGGAEKMPVRPKVDKVLATRLMDVLPQAGTIVSEKEDKELGLVELTLGNGVKVVLKPTDFKNDQVLLSSTRFGGQSLYGEADIYNARYASAIVGQMGLKDFSPSDMQKILAGKSAHVGAYLGGLSEGVSGSAGGADVETMLQLVHLLYTQARKDEAIYSAFISRQQDLAKNALSRPESVLRDTVQTTLFNDNPRVQRVPRVADFDQIKLDRVLEIYRERFASAKGSTFFLVGSFDVDKVKPLIATYLASLPAGDIDAAFKDTGVRPVSGVVKKEVLKGTESKSSISINFSGVAEYSDEEQMRLQALIEVINIKLIEVLREKMGLIYGGGMSAALNKLPYGNYTIGVSLPTGPDSVDKVIAATFAEIDKMKRDGPLASDLAKVKENWSKNFRKALRENEFWLARLQTAAMQDSDPATILRYEQQVAALTPADLQAAALRYFNLDNYVQVVLNPEKAVQSAQREPPKAGDAGAAVKLAPGG
ncbi:MAG: insulinase family protein [Burkholderiaceae bacterium]|nr:insulinase family protein [Burkholderiaceae bacterium]